MHASMKWSRRKLSIDMIIHRGIFNNDQTVLFPCFTFIPKTEVSFYNEDRESACCGSMVTRATSWRCSRRDALAPLLKSLRLVFSSVATYISSHGEFLDGGQIVIPAGVAPWLYRRCHPWLEQGESLRRPPYLQRTTTLQYIFSGSSFYEGKSP